MSGPYENRKVTVRFGRSSSVTSTTQSAFRSDTVDPRAEPPTAHHRYLASSIADPTLRRVADLIGRQEYRGAEQQVQAFLRTRPSDPVAYRLYGQALLGIGDAAAAEKVFRRILDLAPGFEPLRCDLAMAMLRQGRAREALDEIERLLAGGGGELRTRVARAQALMKLGDFDAAVEAWQALVEERPTERHLWLAFGHALRTVRRSGEAERAFRKAISLAPEFGEAWWNIANLKVGALTEDDGEMLRREIGAGRASPADRYHLRFALARLLEEQDDYAACLAEYHRANSERRALLPPAANPSKQDHVRRSVALMTPAFMEDRQEQGAPSDAPIFILGMPRSGSTLLEQMLSMHPAIEATHELPDITILATELEREGGAGGSYLDVLEAAAPSRLRELGESYLQRTGAQRKTDRPRFIDKQWANWAHVALIRLALPNARIIDMRRDALACCLSMYRQHFAQGAAFTYSFETLAEEYRAYATLMDHARAVSPDRVMRVDLERLIVAPEAIMREVCTFLGLPFAPETLHFASSSRPVFTPSSEQVRRPLNQDGERLVAAFEPHLSELLALLNEAGEA